MPCIREGEAASESLATAIDGGYLVELLGKLALGRESRPVTTKLANAQADAHMRRTLGLAGK